MLRPTRLFSDYSASLYVRFSLYTSELTPRSSTRYGSRALVGRPALVSGKAAGKKDDCAITGRMSFSCGIVLACKPCSGQDAEGTVKSPKSTSRGAYAMNEGRGQSSERSQ